VPALHFDLSVPDVRSVYQKAVIVMWLQQVSDAPAILPNCDSLIFTAICFRYLESQAQPVRRVGGYGDGALPLGNLTAQLTDLSLFAFNNRQGENCESVHLCRISAVQGKFSEKPFWALF